MKIRLFKAGRLILAGVFILSPVSCFPAYPPQGRGMAYGEDAKGYDVQQEPPPSGPRMVGVDPALLIAGAAAAGLIGYAIGNHHHHHYDGPVYYRPYGGYYGPRHYYR